MSTVQGVEYASTLMEENPILHDFAGALEA
jgi:hypothetical protein